MNKTKQPLALRLADHIDYHTRYDLELAGTGIDEQAAAELRRLYQSEREGWRYSDELEQERKLLTVENEELRSVAKELAVIVKELCACYNHPLKGE